jgi:heme-degrading monooxygenase HmoA
VIYEMANIAVMAGKEEAFEAGVAQALPLFHRARGCRGVELHRSIEQPDHYVLMVQWETLDDHMVHFRGSEDFQTWRSLVGPYFAQPPVVGHTEVAVR